MRSKVSFNELVSQAAKILVAGVVNTLGAIILARRFSDSAMSLRTCSATRFGLPSV
jgi:hypothetical protein